MRTVRLAVDCMSGDHGPAVMLRGVLEARRAYGTCFVPRLCGDRTRIARFIGSLSRRDGVLLADAAVEHCPESITARDLPSRAWTRKARSPLVRCISLQKEGMADVSMTAGDTGALLSTAVFVLGRLPSVERPALAAFLPTAGKRPALVLDVGANLECRPGHLVCFAGLGSAAYRRRFAGTRPTVALLNIGTEARKGTSIIREADAQLRSCCRGYIGYVEGSDVLAGVADVVVCDGFAGNVLLKVCENLHRLVEKAFRGEGRLLTTVKQRMAVLDPENCGAAPLLGVRGLVYKAHGWSSPRAIANAIGETLRSASCGVDAKKISHQPRSTRT